MNVLYIIIIIFLFVVVCRKSEAFSVTSYNDSYTDDTVDTMYEAETKRLNEIFEQANTEGFPDYKSTYHNLPGYLRFPWQRVFNRVIMRRIGEIFKPYSEYKDSVMTIVKDLYNIYTYDIDIDNQRHFVFSADIRNDRFKWTRRLRFYAILDNLSNFISDTGDYIVDAPDSGLFDLELENSLQIITVSLEEGTVTLSVPGVKEPIGHEVIDSYYRIKNRLHLMDPFVTSGKWMAITDAMRTEFDLELERRAIRERERSRGGFCYSTTNLLANTKEDCIDSGGIWDYPPETSYECPYYNANENYPNDFGGLHGDKCEMPRNMQIIGNRNFSMDPQYLPLCYNCNPDTSIMFGEGTLGYCCDDQNDRSKYPDMITPDYAYTGDTEAREKYADTLTLRGLSIN